MHVHKCACIYIHIRFLKLFGPVIEKIVQHAPVALIGSHHNGCVFAARVEISAGLKQRIKLARNFLILAMIFTNITNLKINSFF